MNLPRQSVTHLEVAKLHAHPANVRKDLGDLTELAASFREHGIIQPVVVTQHPTKPGEWLLLAGHRRTAAARLVKLTKVPAVIRHDVVDETAHLALMLVENTHRSQLEPLERAAAIKSLLDRGMTKTDVARALGSHPSSVDAFVMLLELSDESIEQVRDGEITLAEARDAVREARAGARRAAGTPVRGRPVQTEPGWINRRHPLAPTVRARCAHSRRPKVRDTGCGQCWEAAIREDVDGSIDPGPGDFDTAAVQRAVDGDRLLELSRYERDEVVRRLFAAGKSDGEIALILGRHHAAIHITQIRGRLQLADKTLQETP